MFRYRPYKDCLTEAIIPVAVDYGISGAKKYVSNIKTYEELSNLITTKDYNLYEVCSADIRRIYFDIDDINFTEQELNAFITKLTKTLETQLKIKIRNDEVVVLTNEGSVIYSVHIIYKNLKMEATQQKKLVEYLNESELNEKNIFDNKVYSKNRLFRCLYQTKSKTTETKGLRLDFWKPSFPNLPFGVPLNPLDTFICNTTNCELVEYIKEVKPISRCKRNIQPTQLIEYILELSPKSIFIHNRRRSWNNISLIIKNYVLYDIDKWCELSAKGTRFTKKDNLNFVEENTTEFGIDYIYYLMNNFVVENPYIFYKTEVDKSYLLELFDEDIVEKLIHFINNDEKENGKIIKTLQFSVNGLGLLTINKQTGFIIGDKFKVNYHYDKVISQEYPNILQLNTINDCRTKLEEHTKSKLFVLKSSWGTGKTHNILKSILNSHLFNKILILTSSNSLNQTNTNELNQYIRSIDHDAPLFVSHIETQNDKNMKLHKYSKVVCSIQSLHKIKDSYFDVIFMDEIESILNAYYGYNTFKKGIKGQFLILNQLLCKSSKIIALDADISKPKIDLLIKMIDEPNPVIIKNNDKSFQEVKFIIHTEPFIYEIIEEIINKKKLVIPSASREKAFNLLCILTNTMKKNTKMEKDYEILIRKVYNQIKYINILYIDCEGCKVYKSVGKSFSKPLVSNDYHDYELYVSTEVYKNIEAFIKEHDINVFIYTPTITCGISINESYFDKCYAMSSNRSVNYLEFIQMIMRVRKLNDNENHILIANTLFNTSSTQMTLTRIKQNEIDRNKFITTLKKNEWYEEEMIDDKINEFMTELDEGVYSNLQMINALNQVNTELNFVYNIFSTLNYHKLNVSYYTDTCELEKVYNPQKNKELVNEVLFEMWDNLPILSVSAYYKHKVKIVLELDLEEEEGEDFPTYIKTSLIFNALKLNTIIIQELNEAIATNNIKEVKEIFTKKYDYKGVKILLLDLISIEGMFDSLIKNKYEFWSSYVLNQQYGKLKRLRTLCEKDNNEPFVMNHTSLDILKIEHELLKIFMKYLDIDIRSKETYSFTNQEFEDKINRIPYDDFKKLIFLFETSHNVPRENAGNIYKLVKRLFVSLDYNLKYEDKRNTTRAKDKFFIIPAQKIVNRNKPIQKEIETLDKRFKHLEDRSSPFINHGTTDIQKGLHYINTNQLKKVSAKKLQSSLLLQNPNVANELFYYNPYHYLDFEGTTYSGIYYDKSRNKKTDKFDLHNLQIICYNGDKKNITRPYIPKKVVVKTTPLNKDTTEVNDLMNNLINLVCIRSDLKEHFSGVCGLVEL